MTAPVRPSLTCPICGTISYNPNDVHEQYCVRCHVFLHDEPVVAALCLVGKRVRWVHDACGHCEPMLVTRATRDGLVELEGWSGQFSPGGFVVDEGDERERPK